MMNSMYYNLLSDAFSIYMAFSGILISLLTLLYSFIIGKRSELCAETLKTGNNDPLIKKRQSNLIQQIKKLASINNKVFIILILSMIVCIISWASIRFIPSYYHFGFLFLVGVFSLLIIAITINMLRKLYIQYKNDIKI